MSNVSKFNLEDYKDKEGKTLLERSIAFSSAANEHGFYVFAVLLGGPLGPNHFKAFGNFDGSVASDILFQLAELAKKKKATLDLRVTGKPERME